MADPFVIGNIVADDIDDAIAQARRGSCLCGRTNDLRRGPALWGYGSVCRRCRAFFVAKYGCPWPGEKLLRRRGIPYSRTALAK